MSPEDELRSILLSPKWRIYQSQLQKVQDLGSGSFATVDLCWLTQGNSKQLVAIKRYRPQVLMNPAALNLLRGEIATLTHVKHRHIVRILGLGCEDGKEKDLPDSKLFLVQEYLTGGSLNKLVTQQSLDWKAHGVTSKDVLGWSLQLAQSLAHLHSLDPPILHRDCKLENVMLTMSPSKKWGGVNLERASQTEAADGGKATSAEVRLIDFGLAITLHHAMEISQAASIHGRPSHLDLLKLEARNSQDPSQRKGKGLSSQKKKQDRSDGGARSLHANQNNAANQAGVGLGGGGGGLYDISRTASEAVDPHPVETYSGPTPTRIYPRTPSGANGNKNPPPPSTTLPQYSPPGAVESVRSGNTFVEAQTAAVVAGLENQLLSSKAAQEASVRSDPTAHGGRPAHLTGMTGSLLYMAPEVFKGLDYGTKADVFSFGICLWELVHRRLVSATIFERNFDANDEEIQREIFLHAESVSTGFRPSINTTFVPPSLAGLMRDCLAQNPIDRPTMRTVVAKLQSILSVEEDLIALDMGPSGQGCGCVVS